MLLLHDSAATQPRLVQNFTCNEDYTSISWRFIFFPLAKRAGVSAPLAPHGALVSACVLRQLVVPFPSCDLVVVVVNFQNAAATATSKRHRAAAKWPPPSCRASGPFP